MLAGRKPWKIQSGENREKRMKAMFKVIVDGVEIGRYAHVSVAKKNADTDLECGGFFAEIYRGKKLYASRFYNSEWR